jgi:shikimate kinase
VAPVVVLVGPPGAGKSTVARAVSRRLGVTSRDTDDDIERTTGSSIADLFVERGEQHFRDLERAAVADALLEHDGVLAVGGGAVLDPGTREGLTVLPVVFLDVGIKDAARRIGFNRDRPLLIGNPRAQWIRLMAARRPAYEAVASVTMSTDGRTPDEVADEIVRWCGR